LRNTPQPACNPFCKPIWLSNRQHNQLVVVEIRGVQANNQ
jgi:hypothetical protein